VFNNKIRTLSISCQLMKDLTKRWMDHSVKNQTISSLTSGSWGAGLGGDTVVIPSVPAATGFPADGVSKGDLDPPSTQTTLVWWRRQAVVFPGCVAVVAGLVEPLANFAALALFERDLTQRQAGIGIYVEPSIHRVEPLNVLGES
jgi:hypothetical protein